MTNFCSHSIEETERIAERFSKNLEPGDCVSLVGELGAGKTAFTKAVFTALGGTDDSLVSSPTFTILQEYQTSRGPLHHFDLYRITSYREFENLDFGDYLSGNGISLIEWGDKFSELDSIYTKKVHININDDDTRNIEFT